LHGLQQQPNDLGAAIAIPLQGVPSLVEVLKLCGSDGLCKRWPRFGTALAAVVESERSSQMNSNDQKQPNPESRRSGESRAPTDAGRERPAAGSRGEQDQPGEDGPLDSLGRAVSDAVTGSLPEEVPGSSNPQPEDADRR
jgi:hypothetical protein